MHALVFKLHWMLKDHRSVDFFMLLLCYSRERCECKELKNDNDVEWDQEIRSVHHWHGPWTCLVSCLTALLLFYIHYWNSALRNAWFIHGISHFFIAEKVFLLWRVISWDNMRDSSDPEKTALPNFLVKWTCEIDVVGSWSSSRRELDDHLLYICLATCHHCHA